MSSAPQRFLTNLSKWVLPEEPARLARKLFSTMHARPSVTTIPATLKSNSYLENKHLGQRCFVLGNGPSNAMLDLSRLSGELTIACNHFYKYSQFSNWTPTYYCTGDPFASWSAIGADGMDLFHAYWKNIVENTDCNAYFSHISCKDVLLRSPSPVNEKIHYWSTITTIDEEGCIAGNKVNFSVGAHTPIWLTPMLSVNLAIYMGCNPIYLVGCDTSYLTEFLTGNDYVSHFYAEADWQRETLQKPMSQILYDTYLPVKGFEQLGRYASFNCIKVVDLTPGGFLRCFPKDDYQKVLG